MQSSVDNGRVIGVINDLIETSKDGEYGFAQSAENAKTSTVRQSLMARSAQCRVAATELQQCVQQLGGSPDSSGSMSGALHRGWVSVRSALSTMTELAVLEACEKGEDVAIKRYRDALQEALPDDVRSVVQRQYEGVRRNHDDIKRMRNQARGDGGVEGGTEGAVSNSSSLERSAVGSQLDSDITTGSGRSGGSMLP